MHLHLLRQQGGISIPYGSIKRSGRSPWRCHPRISIPYGSIKRPIVQPRIYNQDTFQFLMVRLKEGRLQ